MAKLINILLRKTDPDYPWGFSLGAVPPALHSIQITWVDEGSLASEHLEPGDRVLEIEGIDTTMLSNSEVESLLTSPSHKLELLVMKKAKPGRTPRTNVEDGCATSKTVKIKDTISSTTEEKGEMKILNEDFIKESKSISTEGTLHRQVMETTESSEKELKTDTFWTCPPSDLVKQDGKKKIKDENLSCKNTSGSSYISESSIFKSLNNYRDELRKIDPREEKRRFWESCRKGDSVRRFKWGDSVRVRKADGSTESLFTKSEDQPIPPPKMERSKSCEPMDCHSSSNPFSESFPGEFQCHASVSPTNPFYKEFETLNQMHCATSETQPFPNSESMSETSKNSEHKEERHITFCNDHSKYDYPTSRPTHKIHDYGSNSSNTVEHEENIFSSAAEQFRENETEYAINSSDSVEHLKSRDTNTVKAKVGPNEPLRLTKAMSKEEFDTKCKFFEKATSVPVSCVNKNAKDLVEERMKDSTPCSSPTTCIVDEKAAGSTDIVVVLPRSIHPEEIKRPLPQVPIPTHETHPHHLRKPSEFISQQLKHRTPSERTHEPILTQTFQKTIPRIEVSGHTMSDDNCEKARLEQQTTLQTNSSPFLPETGTDNRNAVGESAEYDNMKEYLANAKAIETNPCSTTPQQTQDQTQSTNLPQHTSGVGVYNSQTCAEIRSGETQNLDNSKSSFATLPESTVKSSESSSGSSQRSFENSRKSNVHMAYHHQQARTFQDSFDSGFQWFFEGMNPSRALNEQVRSHRGGSLERDFYEKRSFKESSFEKVTRSSTSPYENVESASSREYQEESGPAKSVSTRSKTPAGFYDNSNFEDFVRDVRAKSPLDISSKSFLDIRNRLGSLFGATPLKIGCERSRMQISRAGIDSVEEAFQKLAIQEGIIDSTTTDDGFNS